MLNSPIKNSLDSMKHYSTYQSQFIEMFEGDKYPKTRLGDFVSIRTGKLDANASSENGKYPFFTCGVETLKIDDYAFDCEAVLLAGNGEFCVKYYNGKFNAYQRTYVIETLDNNVISVPYLYAWFGQYAKVLRGKAIGGIIKYIKMGDLTEAKISFPPLEVQNSYVAIAQQADKSKFTSLKSQFIEMFKDLPINGKIEDLVERNIASVKKSYQSGDEIEYIDISSINNTSNTVVETAKYEVASAPSRAQQCVKNGDILVSTVRPINRNIAVVTSNLPDLVASTGFCILRPKDGYCEYLLSVVKSDAYTERMCDKASGGLYPAVNNSDVLLYGIHIPNKELAQKVSSIYQQADKSKYIN